MFNQGSCQTRARGAGFSRARRAMLKMGGLPDCGASQPRLQVHRRDLLLWSRCRRASTATWECLFCGLYRPNSAHQPPFLPRLPANKSGSPLQKIPFSPLPLSFHRSSLSHPPLPHTRAPPRRLGLRKAPEASKTCSHTDWQRLPSSTRPTGWSSASNTAAWRRMSQREHSCKGGGSATLVLTKWLRCAMGAPMSRTTHWRC